MKTYITIILVLVLGCKSIKKTDNSVRKSDIAIPKYQKLNTFKGTTNDTLAYVRTSIIKRKGKYIGKEFRLLLKDLEMPIKTYSPGQSNFIGISPDLSLGFYTRNISELKRRARIDPVTLVVVWKKPLDKERIIEMMLKNDATWTEEEDAYFRKQKIKDLLLVKYNFQ